MLGLLKSIFTSDVDPENKNKALQFLFFLTVVGFLATLLYSFRWATLKGDWMVDLATIIAIGLLFAGASFAIGAFGGFLFGIPKSIANSRPKESDGENIYLNNDNLVEVSDWLTKIIVGVGLTQLMKIPHYFNQLGEFLKGSWGGDQIAKVSSISVVLYYLICGFLMSYLWTRVYFKNMLESADRTISTTDTATTTTVTHVEGIKK